MVEKKWCRYLPVIVVIALIVAALVAIRLMLASGLDFAVSENSKKVRRIHPVVCPATSDSVFVVTETWGIGSGHQLRFISCNRSGDEQFDSLTQCYMRGFRDVLYRSEGERLLFVTTGTFLGICNLECCNTINFETIRPSDIQAIRRSPGMRGFQEVD